MTLRGIESRVPCDGRLHEGPLDDTGLGGAGFTVEPLAQPYDPFVTYSAAVGYPD